MKPARARASESIASLSESRKERLLQRLRSEYVRRNPSANGPANPAGSTKVSVFLSLEEGAQRTDRARIEQHLRKRLPEYMLPNLIHILDAFPTNSNGKIDKAALTRLPIAGDAEPQRPMSPTPPNEMMQSLLAIWERVLGVRSIRETDDFFALGGDSILAIQVVSDARRAGIPLSVSLLFKHPTVASLASCLASSGPATQAAAITSGPTGDRTVPFTPIQQWFFQNRFANPHHWNQSFLLELDPGIPFSAVQQAFRHIYASHDALRLVVREGPTALVQSIQEAAEVDPPIQHRPILPEESADAVAVIEQTANAMHTNLRLSEGRLLRATFFTQDNGRSNKLLLIAHHLCVDAVSWGILFHDLALRLSVAESGSNVGPIPAGNSFRRWAVALPEAARAESAVRSLGFWQDQEYAHCPSIPLDHGDLDQNLEQSAASASVSLSERQTKVLVEKALACEDSVQTFLIAALATTLSDWLAFPRVLIGVEGHGRQDLDAVVDGAGAVGWLTSYHPVVLDLRFADSPGQAFLDIRAQLAQVPDEGRSYGLLRYHHPDPAVREALEKARPEVTFNYLGRAAGDAASAPFLAIQYGIGVNRDPGNRRASIFEINARIVGGCLTVDWQYCHAIHSPRTVETLTQTFAATLDRLLGSNPPAAHALSGPEVDVERRVTLADGQQALLLHRLANPDNDQGELTLSGELVGHLSPDRLATEWDALVAQHPALRATASWSDDGPPLLNIHRTAGQSVEIIDLSNLTGAEGDRALAEITRQKQLDRADIEKRPTSRLTLVKRTSDRYAFIWRCHHLFLDGWSGALILNEWLARLNSDLTPSPGPSEASAAFYEYYDWLASIAPSAPGRFWSDYVQGCEPCLVIDRPEQPGKARSRERATVTCQPGDLELATLRSAAARCRVSPGGLALASWGIVLANLTRRKSVCFGLTHSGRNAPVSRPESIVGNLANLVPFRMLCDANADTVEWVRLLMEEQERISRFGHVSLFRIARWASRQLALPLFDTTLTIANYPQISPRGAVRLEKFKGASTSTTPVSLSLSLGDPIVLMIEYDEQLVLGAGAQYLAAVYTQTLARLCRETSSKLGSFLDGSCASAFRKLSTVPQRHHTQSPAAHPAPKNPPPPQHLSTQEERLLSIFQKTLGQPNAGLRDNFFDLGGTSLQAVQLFNEIERMFRERLPMSCLFRHPTPASLSALLGSARTGHSSFRSLVEIQSGDTRLPPLFLIHAGGLEVLFYKELVDHLDPQLPVYGVQSVGLDRKERPLADIRESARRYVREIQDTRPHGPYFILGHCFGVTVALEMAAQLRNRNFDVPLVISVDGPAPRTISRFERLPAPARPAFARRVINKVRREIAFRLANPDERREMLTHWIQSAYVGAASRHRSERYLGQVLHLKCLDSERFQNQSDLAWQQAVPNVRIEYLGCTHAEVLKKPHVSVVADAVLRALNASGFGALRRAGSGAHPVEAA